MITAQNLSQVTSNLITAQRNLMDAQVSMIGLLQQDADTYAATKTQITTAVNNMITALQAYGQAF